MTDLALTQQARSIFAYSENDLRAAKALKMMLPYGSKLTDDNAIALLLYGKLHGLDPLNGEAYFLVRERTDERTGEKKREELGCYPGVKGKRKKAREQMKAQQGNYWIDFAECDPKEVGLDKSQVAVCCRAELRDSAGTGRYILETVKLKHEGFGEDFIQSVVGKPPVVIGFGVVKNVETKYIKMTPLQLAKKRAESDCLSQRFDLPFEDVSTVEGIDYVDTDFVEDTTPKLQAEAQKTIRPEQEILSDLGFFQDEQPEVEEPETEPAPAEKPQELLDAEALTTSDGKTYGSLTTADLNFRANNMSTKVDDPKVSDEYRQTTKAKLAATRTILNWRASH